MSDVGGEAPRAAHALMYPVAGDGEEWIRGLELDPSDEPVDEAAWQAAEVACRPWRARGCAACMRGAGRRLRWGVRRCGAGVLFVGLHTHAGACAQSSDSYVPMEGDLVEYMSDRASDDKPHLVRRVPAPFPVPPHPYPCTSDTPETVDRCVLRLCVCVCVCVNIFSRVCVCDTKGVTVCSPSPLPLSMYTHTHTLSLTHSITHTHGCIGKGQALNPKPLTLTLNPKPQTLDSKP